MPDIAPSQLDDLAQLLHNANDVFHQRRKLLEEAMEDSQYRHQQRVNEAEQQLREAERAVEEVESEIHRTLAAE